SLLPINNVKDQDPQPRGTALICAQLDRVNPHFRTARHRTAKRRARDQNVPGNRCRAAKDTAYKTPRPLVQSLGGTARSEQSQLAQLARHRRRYILAAPALRPIARRLGGEQITPALESAARLAFGRDELR